MSSDHRGGGYRYLGQTHGRQWLEGDAADAHAETDRMNIRDAKRIGTLAHHRSTLARDLERFARCHEMTVILYTEIHTGNREWDADSVVRLNVDRDPINFGMARTAIVGYLKRRLTEVDAELRALGVDPGPEPDLREESDAATPSEG